MGRPRKAIPFESLPDRCFPADIRKFLGVDNSVVYAMLKSGQIPAVRIGRRWIIPKYKFGIQWGFIGESQVAASKETA